MSGHVQIRITDDQGRVLEHFFVRAETWDLPAGWIEDGETPVQTAVRELLGRTGFAINPGNLVSEGEKGGFFVFSGRKDDLIKMAEPGEQGGYETVIRWS